MYVRRVLICASVLILFEFISYLSVHQNEAGSISNRVTPPLTFTIERVTGDIYLPIILSSRAPNPDLVVDELLVDSGGITMTIRNVGSVAVVDDFWVDAYFDPTQTSEVNKPWKSIAPAGVVRGVTQNLGAGQLLTLTINWRQLLRGQLEQ